MSQGRHSRREGYPKRRCGEEPCLAEHSDADSSAANNSAANSSAANSSGASSSAASSSVARSISADAGLLNTGRSYGCSDTVGECSSNDSSNNMSGTLASLLLTGGSDVNQNIAAVRAAASAVPDLLHILVATPGRLAHLMDELKAEDVSRGK